MNVAKVSPSTGSNDAGFFTLSCLTISASIMKFKLRACLVLQYGGRLLLHFSKNRAQIYSKTSSVGTAFKRFSLFFVPFVPEDHRFGRFAISSRQDTVPADHCSFRQICNLPDKYQETTGLQIRLNDKAFCQDSRDLNILSVSALAFTGSASRRRNS